MKFNNGLFKKKIKIINTKTVKKIQIYQQLKLRKQTKQTRRIETESWTQRAS